ncbi:hypothetical protein FRACYDRAFT_195772 [Fragilariopsis cylindrus CCMP1102]|uniref:Helicase-associated domain-containing protein n=1 Tax=Fragilariopsis cylindrus CCMP1102 TaxID=635003 RepID=A0A1E7ET40_9STRA|nr:hypothetical protein FRACYDRAFT_195772 [Fragilariopsis cylindrus CCMP1102]|eukprot:OEU09131.1 hypothetical protein FRACYDRAFT_195772 [Fragilariopsis cylindrus CCMP1102]
MSYKRWHTEIWHEMYQRLAAYKKQHYDSTSVPQGYKADPKLAIWVTTQRTLYRKNEISEERINYLDSISFVWKTLEIFPWDEMFQRLVTYKKKFKSTLVPQKYPYLGRWVSTQRAYYNKKELSVERINLLESIGFVWNPLDEQWMVMYQKLVTYKKQHRSTKVPWNYTDDPKLGIWVMRQRQVYNSTNSSILTKKRQELLSSIDFTWSAN